MAREAVTKLGIFLENRNVNKAEVCRRTGLRPSRLTNLSNELKTKLTAKELYLIALAIEEDPCRLLDVCCGTLEIPNPQVSL